MKELNETMERTVVICAEKPTVFRYFTDSKRFADWMGAGSTIEGKPGGQIRICYPGGVIASGHVLEIAANERIVFSYGYESGKPIAPGASRVIISLHDHSEGTEVRLRHEFSDATVRDLHIQGWRYQLALFSNVVAQEQHAEVAKTLDEYFTLWDTADATTRGRILERITSPDVRFRDAFGCITGREDLNAHLSAVQQHMPGLVLMREGEPQQCQGTAMARWVAKRKDGSEAARGTNIFHLTPAGLIHSIVGFWVPTPA